MKLNKFKLAFMRKKKLQFVGSLDNMQVYLCIILCILFGFNQVTNAIDIAFIFKNQNKNTLSSKNY